MQMTAHSYGCYDTADLVLIRLQYVCNTSSDNGYIVIASEAMEQEH